MSLLDERKHNSEILIIHFTSKPGTSFKFISKDSTIGPDSVHYLKCKQIAYFDVIFYILVSLFCISAMVLRRWCELCYI